MVRLEWTKNGNKIAIRTWYDTGRPFCSKQKHYIIFWGHCISYIRDRRRFIAFRTAMISLIWGVCSKHCRQTRPIRPMLVDWTNKEDSFTSLEQLMTLVGQSIIGIYVICWQSYRYFTRDYMVYTESDVCWSVEKHEWNCRTGNIKCSYELCFRTDSYPLDN